MAYYIGIDLGTSGTKTVLFDREGKAMASATIEYPLYQPQNGYAEQDPDDWWNAAAGTIRMVLEKSGVDSAEVKGIGISGQMQHMVGCNKSGTVIAVNKDKNAPIFKQCDFGLVGDVNDVLPKLEAAL